MSRDEHGALGRHVVRDTDRLLGIARVVSDREHQLLSEHAACGVDVSNRLFGAAAELLAEGGIAAAHRTGDADDDIGISRCDGKGQDGGEKRHAQRTHGHSIKAGRDRAMGRGAYRTRAAPVTLPSR